MSCTNETGGGRIVIQAINTFKTSNSIISASGGPILDKNYTKGWSGGTGGYIYL
jgi:hypothetical protein